MAPEPFRAAWTSLASACLAALVLVASPAHALRIVDWNVLDYPGSTGPARDPLYRTVLSPLGADVLVTEEQTSQAGITEYLASLNTMEPGQWAAAPFVDGNDTDSGLFYKPAKVQFLGQWGFYPNPATNLRLVHVYRLKPVGYASDGAEFRIYAVHLKASTGSSNVAARLAEATGIRDSMNALPAGTPALVMGDFNFYTGTEGGMQKFVESETNNNGRLYDPLGFENTNPWQDNTALALVWTQSPCGTGDTGCASGAATGGIDDRFDLVLPTYAFNDGSGLELLPATYVSVGNDGLHHNVGITAAPTIPEGAAYAAALHGASDHLPVRVDLQLPAMLSVDTTPIAFGTVIVGAPATHALAVSNPASAPGETLLYAYSAPAGFTAPAGVLRVAAGTAGSDAIALDTSAPGARSGLLQLTSNALDGPTASIGVSGTVLRHASASLDSSASVSSALLDFGSHDAGAFTPMDVRVFDLGWDAQQAALAVTGGAISGGDGRFSIVGGFSGALISGTGQSWSVAFDPANATSDSLYEATLTFTGGDEPLPGAAAQPPLSVTLHAQVTGSPVSVAEGLPARTALFAPYPNPLALTSTLRFDLAHAGSVSLEIFDLSGRRTATLVHRELEPGRYALQWDGRSSLGGAAGAGLYFVRLTAPGAARQTVRLAVVR